MVRLSRATSQKSFSYTRFGKSRCSRSLDFSCRAECPERVDSSPSRWVSNVRFWALAPIADWAFSTRWPPTVASSPHEFKPPSKTAPEATNPTFAHDGLLTTALKAGSNGLGLVSQVINVACEPLLQWCKLLPSRRFSAALNRHGDVLQFRRPQAELGSDFRLQRMIEKLPTMLCTLAVFFRGLHGFPHIHLSVVTFAQMGCRGPVCHPPPVPLGGMLDTRPTPV